LVETGAFREDLFHRLNVIRIHVPKLAERREDIPQLLSYFLTAASQELGVETKSLSSAALDFLTQLPWPGNVRQLENTCRWLTVMAAGREVLLSDLPPELIQQPDTSPRKETDTWHAQLADWANRQLAEGQSNVLRQALPLFESIMIDAALEHSGGKKAEAAELLGWGRNTLTRKLKELDKPMK
jgi:two-component system nitrogen regulation response regulator GlnG